MDEMTLTLSSPITEEQFDAITDVDFDNTERIWFHTKHGKDVEFVKRKKGKWIDDGSEFGCCCSECGETLDDYFDGALYEVRMNKIPNFCPNCGADMK